MRLLALFSVVALLALIAGCEQPTPPNLTDPEPIVMVPGTIQGTVVLDPDIVGTVDRTVAELYCSCDAMLRNQPTCMVAVDENGKFTFTGVCCGTYFIGAWKDNDRNGVHSTGDYSFDRTNTEQNVCCVKSGSTASVTLALVVER
jgi:hypothetical protein